MNEKTNHEETSIIDGNEAEIFEENEGVESPEAFDEEAFTKALFDEEAFGEKDNCEKKLSEKAEKTEKADKAEERNGEDLYTVKYNGEKMSLTLSELKTNAQKGLNYDHVKEEFDRLKNSPAISALSVLAKEQNMSVDELAGRLMELDGKKREDRLTKMGMSEKEAKRIVRLENMERQRLLEKEADRPFEDFVKQYPQVNPKDIDRSVWEEFYVTNNLAAAYARFENRQLKNKIKAMEQNSVNLKKSIGSAKSSAAAFHDAFLEGLYS